MNLRHHWIPSESTYTCVTDTQSFYRAGFPVPVGGSGVRSVISPEGERQIASYCMNLGSVPSNLTTLVFNSQTRPPLGGTVILIRLIQIINPIGIDDLQEATQASDAGQ